MADTYKKGDTFKAVYENAPIPPEQRYKIGQQVSIREDGVLVAIYEVTATDDTNIEGRIVRVFRYKGPVDPRRTRPAANRKTKPL